MLRHLLCTIALAGWAITAGAAAPSADELLSGVDRSRLPWDSAEMEITIRTTQPGKPVDEQRFSVMVGGQERSLVQFLNTENRGQYMLMRKEGMWLYFPKTRRAIRITPLQRLTGNTSNGDIANLPFTGNYAPTLAGEEAVDGIATWVLDLEAQSTTAAYPRIRLWVAEESGLAYRAHYFLASGKLMKTVRYERYAEHDGQPLLAAMTFKEPHRPEQTSEMLFSRITPKEFPDFWFQKSYMPRLKQR